MSSQINFSQLVDEYTKLKGMPAIEWQSGGHFSLSTKSVELNIAYVPKNNEIVIVSYLCVVDQKNIYQTLLKANFALQGSVIGALGLSPSNDVTLNFKAKAIDIDVTVFNEWIVTLVDESKRWQDKIQAIVLSGSQADLELPESHNQDWVLLKV